MVLDTRGLWNNFAMSCIQSVKLHLKFCVRCFFLVHALTKFFLFSPRKAFIGIIFCLIKNYPHPLLCAKPNFSGERVTDFLLGRRGGGVLLIHLYLLALKIHFLIQQIASKISKCCSVQWHQLWYQYRYVCTHWFNLQI